jgi:hypothetical protein
MDGARYTETWGEANHAYIPHISGDISPKGVTLTQFYNNGNTFTSPGHLALISGRYYNLDNSGSELPPFPTIFQYFLQNHPSKSAWLIASKDKLEVLANTVDSAYNNQFMPSTDCGVNGLGSGYRSDSITLHKAMDVLSNERPNLLVVNFREPDYTGHTGDSLRYLSKIQEVDSLIHEIHLFIENDPFYQNRTTLFITTDHGRHDAQNGGFSGHGDQCNGCKHLIFCTYGPDFKSNHISDVNYEQTDLAQTIAELLRFNLPQSEGKIMKDLFK